MRCVTHSTGLLNKESPAPKIGAVIPFVSPIVRITTVRAIVVVGREGGYISSLTPTVVTLVLSLSFPRQCP
jgi:hypothetical protein